MDEATGCESCCGLVRMLHLCCVCVRVCFVVGGGGMVAGFGLRRGSVCWMAMMKEWEKCVKKCSSRQ